MSAHDWDERNTTEWDAVRGILYNAILSHGRRCLDRRGDPDVLADLAASACTASLKKRFRVERAGDRVNVRTLRDLARECLQNVTAGSARFVERQLAKARTAVGIEPPERTARRIGGRWV